MQKNAQLTPSSSSPSHLSGNSLLSSSSAFESCSCLELHLENGRFTDKFPIFFCVHLNGK